MDGGHSGLVSSKRVGRRPPFGMQPLQYGECLHRDARHQLLRHPLAFLVPAIPQAGAQQVHHLHRGAQQDEHEPHTGIEGVAPVLWLHWPPAGSLKTISVYQMLNSDIEALYVLRVSRPVGLSPIGVLYKAHHDKEVTLDALPVQLRNAVAVPDCTVHCPLIGVPAAAATFARFVLEFHSHLDVRPPLHSGVCNDMC